MRNVWLLLALALFAGCAQITDGAPENAVFCDQPRPEVCTREYMPVCGDDNVTYGNDCTACSEQDVEYYVPGACESSESPDQVPNMTACPADAKICSDGSAVGRVGPDCEFALCPGEVRYVSENPDRCAVLNFRCFSGGEPFFNASGCGCASPAEA